MKGKSYPLSLYSSRKVPVSRLVSAHAGMPLILLKEHMTLLTSPSLTHTSKGRKKVSTMSCSVTLKQLNSRYIVRVHKNKYYPIDLVQKECSLGKILICYQQTILIKTNILCEKIVDVACNV